MIAYFSTNHSTTKIVWHLVKSIFNRFEKCTKTRWLFFLIYNLPPSIRMPYSTETKTRKRKKTPSKYINHDDFLIFFTTKKKTYIVQSITENIFLLTKWFFYYIVPFSNGYIFDIKNINNGCALLLLLSSPQFIFLFIRFPFLVFFYSPVLTDML